MNAPTTRETADPSNVQEMQIGPDHIGEANEKVTADHAELAAMKPEDHRVRAVMLACESRMKGYEIPIHAADAKFALDYLLSEIAALRGERDGLIEAAAARNSLLQITERQRDELRKALEWYGEQARLARLIHREGDAGRHALADDGGKLARQALANQGADQ